MSGEHPANVGYADKINRVRCSYIENSYYEKWIKFTTVVKRYMLWQDKGYEFL
jgi:hypothetical protein